jgi:hypothetical protein
MDQYFASGTAFNKGGNKPMSGFEKILDILQRTNYMSANVAEYASGQSPYGGVGEAAWAGLSAKRRLTYSSLTGNAGTGLALDILLDPVTWIPFGGLTKVAKATRIGEAIGNLAEVAGKIPYLGPAGIKSKELFMRGFVDPLYRTKMISGIEDATKALGKMKVSNDLIELAKRGELTEDLVKGIDPAAVKHLQQIDKYYKFVDWTEGLPRELKAKAQATINDWIEINKGYDKFEKVHPKEAKAFLDMMEHGLAVPKNGYFGVDDELIRAVKELGVTDDEISGIMEGIVRPAVQYATPEQRDLFNELGEHVGKITNRPDQWTSEEWQKLSQAALAKLDPSIKPVYDNALRVQRRFMDEGLKREFLVRATIDQFATDTGLAHIRHIALDKVPAHVKLWQQNGRMRLQNLLQEDLKEIERAADELDEVFKTKDYGIKGARKPTIPKEITTVIDKINEGKLDDLATNPDIVTNFRVALKGFLKDIKAGPKVNSAIARFEKHIEEYRRFRSLNETANKINEIAGKKVFETNLATIFWKEENRLNEAVIYHDYLKKLIDANLDFVQKIDPTKVVEIPKDFARIDDELLGSFHVHKDLLEPFRLTVNYAKGQGDDWAEFVKLTDRVTSNIKYSILIPFPKFHIRNIVSEISFNAIAGMNPLLDPKILEDYTFALKEWKLAKAGKASEWYIRAIKDGAIQTGFMRSEAATEIAGKWKKIPGVGHYLRGMETVGSLSEEMPRLAMYRWAQRGGVARLKKFSVKSAGELVSRFHVDYSKLTPFERSSLRRLMPFYSWYRFNIPMNIKMLQEAPGFYANVDKTRKAITEARGGELPQDWTPEYIREGYAIGWSKSPGKKTYIIMRGWYPAADLSSVTSIDNAKDQFVGMLHPAKIIPETIWGYDTFTKRKIPAYPGQKVKMFGVNIPARPAHLLAPIRVIQETNALIFGKTTYQSKFYDRIVYAIFGKMYEVDEAKVKKYLKWDMERMINDIENKGIPNAQKNGDYRTVRTLQKQATKLKAQEAKL